MTRMEITLGTPAAIPDGMLLGIVAATRWIGTGGASLPEEVGAAGTGAGGAPEIIAGAIAGAG
jgi:hypothetical protein